MKINKKKKNNIIVYCVVIAVLFIIIGLLFYLVYDSLFASSNSTRLDDSENYVLSETEKNEILETFVGLDEVVDSSVLVNVKIIKIFLYLSKDVDLKKIKKLSDKALSSISEENLSFYDVEIFIDSEEESEIYPKIGYKHKSSLGFAW